MNARILFVILVLIIGTSAALVPAFASPYALSNNTGSTNVTSGNTGVTTGGNTGGVTVTTDKVSYKDGDTITISGTVSSYVSDTPITLQIISPIGENVKIDQVDVGSDRTFSTTITDDTGLLWQQAGGYTVKVQYGSSDRTAQTTFQFAGSTGGQENTIKVDGTDLSVKYSITNGQALGMRFDDQSKSIIVSIQATGNGVLTVTLPRALISPTLPNGQDDKYYISEDGKESDFQEIGTTTIDRTLSIPFTDGTGEIIIASTPGSSTNPTSSNPVPTSTITVTTDKSSYSNGDTITISGTVSGYISNVPISIRINDPRGNIIKLDQVNLESDRTFSTTITDDTGLLWQQAGVYTVKAVYGSPDIVGQTIFQFSGNQSEPPTTAPTSTITVTTDKSSYIDGDVMTISGTNSNYISGTYVTVQIISPSGGLVIDDQVEDYYKTFSKSLVPTGTLWQEAGTYTVKVTYNNNPDMVGQTTFQFSGSSGSQLIPPTTALITASVAKSSYTQDDTIVVSGQVQSVLPGTPVVVQIFDPNNNLVQSAHVDVSENGRYVDSIPIIGPYWKPSGTYTLKVQYDPPNVTAETTFVFSSSSSTSTITVTTDKLVYDHNSDIIITGHADPALGQEISLKITSPSGNVVIGDQASTDNNGNFVTHVATVGNIWFENGQYTLAVQQGENRTRFDSTVFQISGVGPIIASSPQPTTTPMTPVTSPTQQDIESINQAKVNQTIAAEVNVGNNKTETRSIDNGVTVQTTSSTPDSLGVTVNASSQTGPKVIVFNINATTINVSNLKDLGVTYDGKSISPAPNMDAILHAKSTDNPSFAIVVTQSGVQVLVLVPHFSTHTITITNMSKVIPSVPEFGPVVGIVVVIAVIGCIMMSRRFFKA